TIKITNKADRTQPSPFSTILSPFFLRRLRRAIFLSMIFLSSLPVSSLRSSGLCGSLSPFRFCLPLCPALRVFASLLFNPNDFATHDSANLSLFSPLPPVQIRIPYSYYYASN